MDWLIARYPIAVFRTLDGVWMRPCFDREAVMAPEQGVILSRCGNFWQWILQLYRVRASIHCDLFATTIKHLSSSTLHMQ
jgi:hypothetical protein